jgi:hypothetical protein
MSGVLVIEMNDDAVATLGVLTGQLPLYLPGKLTPGLEMIVSGGIVRRGDVLVWTESAAPADAAPGEHRDLTSWECADSRFNLEDAVPVAMEIVGDALVISESNQRRLLAYALAFTMRLAQLANGLTPPASVRCIITANETNATFRFHQIRAGERWHAPDLDSYQQDKLIVIDVRQPGSA